MSTNPLQPTQERARFEAWFNAYWAGDDPEDPCPVPLSGDWQERRAYDGTKAAAWAAWTACANRQEAHGRTPGETRLV